MAALTGVVQNLHVAALPDVFRPAGHSGVVDMIRSGMDRPDLAAWLAEQDGTAVGYILTTIHERAATVFHRSRRILEVDQIGVRPDYQRQGIGRALFDCALAHARASAVDEVVLSAWAFNERAHTAFRRWGLTPRVIQFSLASTPASPS